MNVNESPVQRTPTEVKDPSPAKTRARHFYLAFLCLSYWFAVGMVSVTTDSAVLTAILAVLGFGYALFLSSKIWPSSNPVRGYLYAAAYLCLTAAAGTWTGYFYLVEASILGATEQLSTYYLVALVLPILPAIVHDSVIPLLIPVFGLAAWYVARFRLKSTAGVSTFELQVRSWHESVSSSEQADHRSRVFRHRLLFAWCVISWFFALLLLILSFDRPYLALSAGIALASATIFAQILRVSKNRWRSAIYGLAYFSLALAPGSAIFGVVFVSAAFGTSPFSFILDPFVLALFVAGLILPIGAALMLEAPLIMLVPVLGMALWVYASKFLKEPPAQDPAEIADA